MSLTARVVAAAPALQALRNRVFVCAVCGPNGCQPTSCSRNAGLMLKPLAMAIVLAARSEM
jgi:hypothetical protein